MTDLKKAAEMALEALENPGFAKPKGVIDAIMWLRQALAQPECVDSVNMTQKRVDETAKREHITDRERLEAIVSVVCRYLPPDGIDIKAAMSEIIELVDPLPPKREWVGLTDKQIYEHEWWDEETAFAVNKELKEKNT